MRLQILQCHHIVLRIHTIALQTHSLSLDATDFFVLSRSHSIELYAIDVDSNGTTTTTTTVGTKIPFPDATNEHYYWSAPLTGSCNGLLCVGATPLMVGDNQACKLFLINPSTWIFREIPLCVTDYRASVCGFGFDDTNNDYKVVCITQIYDRHALEFDEVFYDRVVRVFSINENAWKVVENVVRAKERIASYENGVLIRNRLLHWLFWDHYGFRIACFDVQSEKWVSDVPLMKSFSKDLDQLTKEGQDVELVRAKIGVLHECLCLAAQTNVGEIVWMMKDYGVEASWIKLFHTSSSFLFPFCFNGSGPFGFRKGSKVEVLVQNNYRVGGLRWCFIGSETHGITEEISGVPKFFQACFLKGSLVPIPGGKRIEAPEAIR